MPLWQIKGNYGVQLCLHAEDMLICGIDTETIKGTKKVLTLKFDMKDLDDADVILGRSQLRLALTQSNYIRKFSRSLTIS